MKYLKITNTGEVEEAAFSLLGASTKDGESSIGFFGSGNKYAFAFFLREKIPFRVFSGEKEYKFTTKSVTLRDQVFEQVLINRKRTSITTRMGPDWKLWFAIRELISNAIDEGGFVLEEVEEVPVGEEGKTVIFLQMCDEIEEFMAEKDKYFLPQGGEILETVETRRVGKATILPAEDRRFNIFRKGICVNPGMDEKGLFHYNFENIEISESRVVRYVYQIRENVALTLARAEDEEIIRTFVSSYKGTFEENIDWRQVGYWGICPSDSWKNVLIGKTIIREGLVTLLPPEDVSSYTTLPNDLVDLLEDTFPELDIFGSKSKDFVVVEPTREEMATYNIAMKRLERIWVNIPRNHVFVKVENDSLYAWYDRSEKKTYVVAGKMSDVEETVLTLYEEYLHTKGFDDGSRVFERYLMKEIIREKEINALKEKVVEDGTV